MNTYVALVALLPFPIAAFIIFHPEKAVALLAELKRRIRLFYIDYFGKKQADRIFHILKMRAIKKGYSEQEIDEFTADYKAELIERCGTRAANEGLGDPDIIERYF